MDVSFIRNIYETGFVQDSDGRPVFALRSGIPFDEGMAIYGLIRRTKPQRTLEVGMAYGLSTLFACQAHADNGLGGVHTAIDPAQSSDFGSVGLLNVQRAGLECHLKFLEAPSHEALPRLLQEKDRFGFVFIDGMHVFDFVLVDFFYADLLLETNAYVMFDDLWMPSVRKAVVFVLRNRRYRLDPQWIWQRQSLPTRMAAFVRRDAARGIKLKTAVFHQLRHPLDWSGAYFALKGNLKYQVLQKVGEDSRCWDHHKAF